MLALDYFFRGVKVMVIWFLGLSDWSISCVLSADKILKNLLAMAVSLVQLSQSVSLEMV